MHTDGEQALWARCQAGFIAAFPVSGFIQQRSGRSSIIFAVLLAERGRRGACGADAKARVIMVPVFKHQVVHARLQPVVNGSQSFEAHDHQEDCEATFFVWMLLLAFASLFASKILNVEARHVETMVFKCILRFFDRAFDVHG